MDSKRFVHLSSFKLEEAVWGGMPDMVSLLPCQDGRVGDGHRGHAVDCRYREFLYCVSAKDPCGCLHMCMNQVVFLCP